MSEITVDGERVDAETGVVLGPAENGLPPVFATSAETGKLDEALAKAQGEIEVAEKDKMNPHFRSRYSDITAVWLACRKALAKHGLAVTQWPIHAPDRRLHLVTRIAHNGEWIQARFSLPAPKDSPQGYGSAVTYARRYALSAALGVVSEEDDDGQAAEREEKPGAWKKKQQPPQYKPDAPATEKQKNFLSVLIKDENITDAERKQLEKALDKGMTRDVISKAISRTQDKIKEREGEAPEAQAEPNGGSSEAEPEAPPPSEEKERKEAFVQWEKLWRSYPKLGGAADRQAFEARVLKARGDLFHRGKGTIDHTKLTPAEYGKLAETLTDELTGEGFFTDEEVGAAVGADDA